MNNGFTMYPTNQKQVNYIQKEYESRETKKVTQSKGPLSNDTNMNDLYNHSLPGSEI